MTEDAWWSALVRRFWALVSIYTSLIFTLYRAVADTRLPVCCAIFQKCSSHLVIWFYRLDSEAVRDLGQYYTHCWRAWKRILELKVSGGKIPFGGLKIRLFISQVLISSFKVNLEFYRILNPSTKELIFLFLLTIV